MRLRMGGCVAKRSAQNPWWSVSLRPRGSAMQRWAMPRPMARVGSAALSIFSRTALSPYR